MFWRQVSDRVARPIAVALHNEQFAVKTSKSVSTGDARIVIKMVRDLLWREPVARVGLVKKSPDADVKSAIHDATARSISCGRSAGLRCVRSHLRSLTRLLG